MKKYIIAAFSIACLGLSSCTDVLDRPSETKYTDDTYWTSKTNIVSTSTTIILTTLQDTTAVMALTSLP